MDCELQVANSPESLAEGTTRPRIHGLPNEPLIYVFRPVSRNPAVSFRSQLRNSSLDSQDVSPPVNDELPRSGMATDQAHSLPSSQHEWAEWVFVLEPRNSDRVRAWECYSKAGTSSMGFKISRLRDPLPAEVKEREWWIISEELPLQEPISDHKGEASLPSLKFPLYVH